LNAIQAGSRNKDRKTWRPQPGIFAEDCIPSGQVVAVGFVFDGSARLKNEATLRAYSRFSISSVGRVALPQAGAGRGFEFRMENGGGGAGYEQSRPQPRHREEMIGNEWTRTE